MNARTVLTAGLCIGLMGFVSACGDDEESTTGASAPPRPATASGDVTIEAREYAFDNVPETIEAGKTSFTLENVGQEEHEMFIARINEGHTFDEAIEAEGEKGTAEEIGGVRPIEPGETSKPFDANLKPGNYGMLCFVQGPDGQPHFVLGQKAEFTVE